MDATFNMVFAKRLKYFMEIYGFSQKDLAKRMEISEASVSNWVKGIKVPRADKVDKLCVLFGCNRSDLVEDPSLKTLEQELISNYKKLPPEEQETVRSLIKVLQQEQPDPDRALEIIGKLTKLLHS